MSDPTHRTTFGRRMITVFFLCILVPVVLFGYLSIKRVDEKLRDDTIRRMSFQTREVAMSLHTGLGFVREQTKFLSFLANGKKDRAGLEWLADNRLILGVSRIHEGSRQESLYGNPCPPPLLDRPALAHLATGRGILFFERGGSGMSRLFLARAIPGKSPERELLSFEVNREYLWELVQDSAPPSSEVYVLSPDGGILYQTGAPPPGLLERVLRERDKGHLGNFEWKESAEPLLAFHAMVFLKPAFLSGNWTVAVTRHRSEAFASANQFIRILFLTVASVVLAAGLFALVQVRRSVAPLAVLKAGTRRISEGDFYSRIEIGSGDEFEELARSFNTMADHLGMEFQAQAELGRIIQAILGETERGKIVRTLLDNLNRIIPCDRAGLSLLEASGEKNSAITCFREGASEDLSGIGRTRMFLEPGEIDRLKATETAIVATPEGKFARFLSRWPAPHPATFLLAPLFDDKELTGVLVLGYLDSRNPASETLVRLRQIADQTTVALSRARLVEELNENDLGTLQALSRAVDTNSPWTAGHSQRVTAIAMEIGWELGLPPREIDLLQRGGLLHDIGKLGIPASILDKPGRLTEEEFACIKRHPSAGVEILRPIPALDKVIPLVAQHHERYDGAGYPARLAGEAISLHARIVAVADVVDALSSDRPYRPGWDREKVLSYLAEESGRQFDPGVAAAFLRIAGRLPRNGFFEGIVNRSSTGRGNGH